MTAFWEAIESFNKNYKPPEPVEYRLYYTDTGEPLFYTTDYFPEGNYVVIDRKTYQSGDYNNVRVIDGVLRIKKTNDARKLVPSEFTDGTPCHPDDITIITSSEPKTYWKTKDYEYR